MWPIRLVVVVLPFEPVIPMVLPLQKRRRQFHLADHRTPRRRAASSGGRSAGTSGESTIRSQPSNTSGDCCANGTSDVQQLARLGSWSSGFRSVARTSRALRARSNSTAAMPDFSMPDHQRSCMPSSSMFYLSFNVVSANSASTRPAIQKRAMIFDSVQPSASK